jgi:hypothetical protein
MDLNNSKDKQLWEMLGSYKVSEPKAGFVNRFWIKIIQGSSKAFSHKIIFLPRPWAFASLALTMVFFLSVPMGIEHYNLEKKLSTMPAEDVEMIKNLELAQYWQGIEHMDSANDSETSEQEESQGNT